MQPFKKCTPLGRPLLGPQGTPFWPFRVKVRRRSCTSSFAFSSSRTSASCRRRSTARALLSSASCGRPGPSPAAAMSVSFPAPGRGWLWGAAIRLHTFLNGRRPGKQPWGSAAPLTARQSDFGIRAITPQQQHHQRRGVLDSGRPSWTSSRRGQKKISCGKYQSIIKCAIYCKAR